MNKQISEIQQQIETYTKEQSNFTAQVDTLKKQYKETQESTQTRFNQAQALSELTPTSELNQTKNFLAEVSVKTGNKGRGFPYFLL